MNSRLLTCLTALWVTFGLGSLAGQTPSPVIAPVALRFTLKDRLVTAAVERGVSQVVLEQKAGEGWKPLSVAYSSLRTGRVVFKLATSIDAADLRVQGYRNAKFPARFLRGKRVFDRQDLTINANGGVLTIGNIAIDTMGPVATTGPVMRNFFTNTLVAADTATMAMGSTTLAANSLTTASTATITAEQPIVESDIWQIVGNQVYFFNQYRGLQILDLTEPTLPVRTGSLRLPASGEQMFVLDAAGTQVALLGRSNDKGREGAATVWLIRVTDGVPVMTGEVPLDGAITDSRLVGTTLHVLCNIQTPGTNNLDWTSDAVLTSIDLHDLDAPQKLGSLSFPSTTAALQAAEGHLLVSTTYHVGSNMYLNRAVHLVESAAAPKLVKSLIPRGVIQDKFKMGIVNGSVVTVSIEGEWNNRKTWVETFPITTRSVTAQAALELEGARGEVLHATRFDGDRLYVVTFRQIDPLFIIDLADPAAPVLSGVLEVPGWSTYLEPLGDRLLAVGVEGGNVTVSLFDVTDVTAPALLSRLPLGSTNFGSWSEATYDEKAVEYLPEEGIVMVPFEGYASVGGTRKAIQVVHVGEDALTAGPTIAHEFNPRRGNFISGHYITISGHELKVHSTEEGEGSSAPVVSLPLAWCTDRVVPVGGHLIQIEDGSGAADGYNPVINLQTFNKTVIPHAKLRITSTTDPDALEQVIDLGAGRIVGITQRDDRLYLAQWVPSANSLRTWTTPQLRTLALDVSSTPPVVTETGRSSHDITGVDGHSIRLDLVKPLWVTDEKLVWHLPVHAGYYNTWISSGPIVGGPVLRPIFQPITIGGPVTIGIGIIALPGATILPVRQGTTVATGSLLASPPPAEAVADSFGPDLPAAILCPVAVDASGGLTAETAHVVRVRGDVRGTSTAFLQNGFLFFSYDVPVAYPAPAVSKSVSLASRLVRSSTNTSGNISIIPYRPQDHRVASWLQVIDWNPGTPVLRDPVSIPGPLLSVAQADAQGAVILTNSDQQISKTGPATRVVQASAYDGVSAWQLDSYITSTPFRSATATDGVRLYLGREVGTVGVVGLGYNSVTGRLAQINTWPTAESPSVLHVISGHLLASSLGNLEVATITASSGVLKPVASYDTPTNLCLRVDRAAFTATQDLWIPAAEFGVELLQRAALAP